MQTQHTPAPWEAQGSRIIQAGKMKAWQLIIASLPTTIDPKPTPDAVAKDHATRDANARLIAAAPDLLVAASNAANVLAALATGQLLLIKPDSAALAQLRAAIAKATNPHA